MAYHKDDDADASGRLAVHAVSVGGAAAARAGHDIFRYEDDWTATVVADRGERDVPLPVGSCLSLKGESATALVRRTGRAARVDDFSGATGPLADYTRNAGIGSTVDSPIVVDGRLWGAMIAATRTDEPMPADTESQIEQFTELVATAISNMHARSDLAASRARIVRRPTRSPAGWFAICTTERSSDWSTRSSRSSSHTAPSGTRTRTPLPS